MNTPKMLTAAIAFMLVASRCFSAEKIFLEGAKHKVIADGGGKTDKRYMIGYFNGYVSGVLDSKSIPAPNTLNRDQICSRVATFIQQHPQEHDKSAIALIAAALQQK